MTALQSEMSQLSSLREAMAEAHMQLQTLTDKQTSTEQNVEKLQKENGTLEETKKTLERRVSQMRRFVNTFHTSCANLHLQ